MNRVQKPIGEIKSAKNQPFFSVFNLMTSHQSRSMVWPYSVFKKHVQSQLSVSEIHDPKEAPVPQYYPDTDVVRKNIARYYDCVTVMDKQVGEIIRQLEDDGLADDTIIFSFRSWLLACLVIKGFCMTPV